MNFSLKIKLNILLGWIPLSKSFGKQQVYAHNKNRLRFMMNAFSQEILSLNFQHGGSFCNQQNIIVYLHNI